MPKTALSLWTQERWAKSGLTQVPFVKALGLDINVFGEQTLSKFISGRYKYPPNGLIQALANKYGVPEAELRGYQEKLDTELPSPPKAELDPDNPDLPSRERLDEMIADHERKLAFHQETLTSLKWIRDNYEAHAKGIKTLKTV